MSPIRVAVHGAAGKMGQEIVRALCREPEMELVGAVDVKAAANYLELPEGSGKARDPVPQRIGWSSGHGNAPVDSVSIRLDLPDGLPVPW